MKNLQWALAVLRGLIGAALLGTMAQAQTQTQSAGGYPINTVVTSPLGGAPDILARNRILALPDVREKLGGIGLEITGEPLSNCLPIRARS